MVTLRQHYRVEAVRSQELAEQLQVWEDLSLKATLENGVLL